MFNKHAEKGGWRFQLKSDAERNCGFPEAVNGDAGKIYSARNCMFRKNRLPNE